MPTLQLTREDTEEDVVDSQDPPKDPPIRHRRCPNCAERVCDGEILPSPPPASRKAKPCPACFNNDRTFAHRRYCRGDWQP